MLELHLRDATHRVALKVCGIDHCFEGKNAKMKLKITFNGPLSYL